MRYIMVPERHRDGRLHIHALTDTPLTTRWWKDNGAGCGLGYIAEEEAVRSAGMAAGYVAKYLAKMLAGHGWPRGFHRVRTSRNWPREVQEKELPGWSFLTFTSEIEANESEYWHERRGYHIEHVNHLRAWGIIQYLSGDGARDTIH
jgi:hypothetical protein